MPATPASCNSTIDATDADEFEVFKTGDRISVRHPSRWGRRGRNSTVGRSCAGRHRRRDQLDVGRGAPGRSAWASCACTPRPATSRLATLRASTSPRPRARSPVATSSGERNVSSVSGDCTLQRVGGRLDATLTSGDLRVDECDGDVVIGSTSGDVRVGRCGGTDIAVRSISGDVRVGLPSGIRVEAEISTLSGRATLPEPASASDFGDRTAGTPAAEDGVRRHPRRDAPPERAAVRASTRRLLRHGSACGCCRDLLDLAGSHHGHPSGRGSAGLARHGTPRATRDVIVHARGANATSPPPKLLASRHPNDSDSS